MIAFQPGDPYADRNAELAGRTADLYRRRFDALAQAFRHRISVGHIGFRHHHNEFFAAEAAGQIDPAHVGSDASGKFLQYFIADVVAMIVVDRLEEIDVHHDEGERLAALARLGKQVFQAVVQTGELVGDRHLQAELHVVAQPVRVALLAQLRAHARD